MGQIFISYARADSRVVDQLVKQIEKAGHQVWIDRGGIQAGEQWRASIVEAIEAADVVVVILSNESVKSDNLRKDVDLSETKRRPILPVMIEKVDIPPGLEYQLSGI